ncbi:hypothetical protein [Aquimarina brevivitae]|uniref:Uncharacterized protein n=1 Tax=Aquimarina brevivitae TaxID=323412 RepID=A0A4Q7NU13_9FLAO|nr:hypothetical protein [Aquimarina brevivitae]RZS90627.1 hypothetical protein EV197_3156 [Aquimarina brevivitae]
METHTLHRNILKRISLLLWVLILISACNSEEFSAEKTIQTKDVAVTLSYHYDINATLDIVALPHVPIMLPGRKKTKKLYVAVHIAGREDFVVEHITAADLIEDPDRLQKLAATTEVLVSPNTDKLIYKRKRKAGDTIIGVSYMDQKYPFIDPYFDQEITSAEPAWDQIKSIEVLAKDFIGNDAEGSLFYGYTQPEFVFWTTLRKLTPENTYDWMVLQEFFRKEYNMEHIQYRCKDWEQRSERWKQSVRRGIAQHYTTYPSSNDYNLFFYKGAVIETIIEDSKDETIAKDYFQFLLANFEKGIVGTANDRLKDDAIFRKKYRDTLVSRCEIVLQSKEPQHVISVLDVANTLNDTVLLKKANLRRKELDL